MFKSSVFSFIYIKRLTNGSEEIVVYIQSALVMLSTSPGYLSLELTPNEMIHLTSCAL